MPLTIKKRVSSLEILHQVNSSDQGSLRSPHSTTKSPNARQELRTTLKTLHATPQALRTTPQASTGTTFDTSEAGAMYSTTGVHAMYCMTCESATLATASAGWTYSSMGPLVGVHIAVTTTLFTVKMAVTFLTEHSLTGVALLRPPVVAGAVAVPGKCSTLCRVFSLPGLVRLAPSASSAVWVSSPQPLSRTCPAALLLHRISIALFTLLAFSCFTWALQISRPPKVLNSPLLVLFAPREPCSLSPSFLAPHPLYSLLLSLLTPPHCSCLPDRTFHTSGTAVCKLRNRCFQLSSRLSVLLSE